MPMDLQAIGAALRGWLVAATGYPESRVVYADQDGPRPARPFATLKFTGVRPLGLADELEAELNLGAPAGEEYTFTAVGVRELGVSVQFFAAPAAGVTAGMAATMAASKAKTALALPTVREAIRAAGAATFDGDVSDLSAVLDDDFEGRALLELRLYANEDAAESVGYIETVEVDGVAETEDGMLKTIKYDLLASEATSPKLNNLMASRAFKGSQKILLGPGTFDLAELLTAEDLSYVRIVGAGMGETILRARFSPSSSLADDATNSFLKVAGKVVAGGISTTLFEKATRGTWRVRPTATPNSTWVGKYFRVKGRNVFQEEAGSSDGVNHLSCDIFRVASVAAPYVILESRLRVHLSGGLAMEEVVPVVGFEISDLTVSGVLANSIATGIELRHAFDCVVQDVALEGFTRSDVGVFWGSHDCRVSRTYRIGGSNAHLMMEASHGVVVEGTRCNPRGERFHPSLGVKRHLLTNWGDHDALRGRDLELVRAGGGLFVNGGKNPMFDGVLVRDMYLDPLNDSLATAGETALTENVVAAVNIGCLAAVDWEAMQLNGVFNNITVEECFSEHRPGLGRDNHHAIGVHACAGLQGSNWQMFQGGSRVSQSEAPISDGHNYIRPLWIRDVDGRIENVTAKGHYGGILLDGNLLPELAGGSFNQNNGNGSEAAALDSGWSVGIRMDLGPLANQSPIIIRRWTFNCNTFHTLIGSANAPHPNSRLIDCTFAHQASECRWALNWTGGAVLLGQAVALDEVGAEAIAGFPQMRTPTAAFATQLIYVAFAGSQEVNGNGNNMTWAAAIAPKSFARVRSADVVRSGDRLVPDVAGGGSGLDWKVDNAAGAGFVFATSAKAAGAPAIVQTRAP